METKYLRFDKLESPNKTDVIGVFAKNAGVYIGTIKWFAHWRQYTFFPKSDSVYNSECLQDIRYCIQDLMSQRKIKT